MADEWNPKDDHSWDDDKSKKHDPDRTSKHWKFTEYVDYHWFELKYEVRLPSHVPEDFRSRPGMLKLMRRDLEGHWCEWWVDVMDTKDDILKVGTKILVMGTYTDDWSWKDAVDQWDLQSDIRLINEAHRRKRTPPQVHPEAEEEASDDVSGWGG